MNTALRPFVAAITLLSHAAAQDAAPSAQELAARLSANVQDGSSLVRVKMNVNQTAGGGKSVFQLQIKARRTKAATDVIYHVLWPKDRKGESILLRRTAGGAFSGSVFTPSGSLVPVANMQDALLGGDLSYEDIVVNFFAWPQQAIVGTETVDRVPCQILESKPGRGDSSSYARVRSWIDMKRFIPLRIEKYHASGQLAKRIDTTRVAEDDTNRRVPASFLVRRPGQTSVTELEGSNSKHDVSYSDADFTPEALRALAGSK